MSGQVKIYKSDLTPEQCQYLEFLMMPKGKPKAGRPQEWLVSSIINAIMYVVRSGCQWRILPSGFPPWQTIYYHYNKCCKRHTWKRINDAGKKINGQKRQLMLRLESLVPSLTKAISKTEIEQKSFWRN